MNVVKYNSPEQKPMIFISYAHEDTTIVKRFAEYLTEQGYAVWLDTLRIEAGEAFNPAIDLNLKACELFLVFLSRHYVEKNYCNLEFNIAIDNKKTIITVCLDDVNRNQNQNAAYMFNSLSGINAVNYGVGIRTDADFQSVCQQLCSSSMFQWTRLTDAEREHSRMMLSTTAALMDRLEFHRKAVYKSSGNYHLDEIHAELFPGLQDEDLRVLYFDEEHNEHPLYSYMRDHSHQHFLLVGDGGMGKTVAMMGVCTHLRSQGIPAVYIPLRAIDFRRDTLTKYIQRVVCGNNSGYWNELDKHRQTLFVNRPNLVLLLDGINEIPSDQMRMLIQGELLGEVFRDWKGTQVIMSSRYDFRSQYDDLEQNIQVLSMQLLDPSQVGRYLEKCSLPELTDENMLRLLGNPLLLSLYANAEACRKRYGQIRGIELDENPNNPGKIIGNFLKTQLYRAFQGTYSNLPEHLLVLEYMLPAMAHHMVCSQRLSITDDEFGDLMDHLEDDVRLSWYKRDRLGKLMRALDLEEPEWKESRMHNLAVRGLHFLQKTDQDNYEFLHQLFRDYFAAHYIANEITAVAARPKRLRESEPVIQSQCYSEDIIAFASNITREELASPVLTEDGWQFPGKSSSEKPSDFSAVEKVLDLYRGIEGEEPQRAVYNLIQIMRKGRSNMLAWCDFSRLDLRRCSMNKCRFVLWHREQIFPSRFDGAWIDRTFLLNQGHESNVTAICTDGENLIFSGDKDGVVRIYDLEAHKWKTSIQRQHQSVVDLAWDAASRTLAILYANAAYTCSLESGDVCQTCVNEHRSKKYRYVRFGTDGGLEISYDIEPLIYYTMDGQRIAPNMDYDVVVKCARWHPKRLEYIRSYMFHMISSNFFNEETNSWWQHRALLKKRDDTNRERTGKKQKKLNKCYLRLQDDGVGKGDSVRCLCYHHEGDRFLVAIHNLILEYDNQSMTLIRKKELPGKVHALCYGKNDTVYAGSGSSIVVLDPKFSVRLTLPGVPTATIIGLNPDPNGDGYYVRTNYKEIKKLDSQLRVQRIRVFNDGTGSFNWCRDRGTGEYQMLFLPGKLYPNGSRYNFETDTAQPLGWNYEQLELWPGYNRDDHRVYNMIDYLLMVDKTPPYTRTTFVNYRGVWIFGCSFLDIRGDMADKKNIHFLRQNGGITNA